MIPPKRAALAAMVVLGLTGASFAAPAVVSATNLNLRTGPGGRYPVIAVMPHGAALRTIRCTEEWCQVRYRGVTGYAAREHLDTGEGSYASAPPVVLPAPVTPPDPGARIWRWHDREARERHIRSRQWRLRHR